MKFRKIKDFLKYEFIGLFVEVIKSRNKNMVGIHGEIIDETKNTFAIRTPTGIKIIPKEYNTFLFYYNGYWILVDGKHLVGRPWERLKRKIVKKV